MSLVRSQKSTTNHSNSAVVASLKSCCRRKFCSSELRNNFLWNMHVSSTECWGSVTT